MAIQIGTGLSQVEESGVSGPFSQPKINFIQAGATAVSVVDNAGQNRVDVTISSTDTTGVTPATNVENQTVIANNPFNFNFTSGSTNKVGTTFAALTALTDTVAYSAAIPGFNSSMTVTFTGGAPTINITSGHAINGSDRITSNMSGSNWQFSKIGTSTGSLHGFILGWA
jgi:hypothetical protein